MKLNVIIPLKSYKLFAFSFWVDESLFSIAYINHKPTPNLVDVSGSSTSYHVVNF